MTRVLVTGVVKLAKMFIKQIKNAKKEDEEMNGDVESDDDQEGEDGEVEEEKKLHWNAGK